MSLQQCSYPRAVRTEEGEKLFRFWGASSLLTPSLLPMFLISLLWKLRPEKGPCPSPGCRAYRQHLGRAGTERSRCSAQHAHWPSETWALTSEPGPQRSEAQHLGCGKQVLGLFLLSSPIMGYFGSPLTSLLIWNVTLYPLSGTTPFIHPNFWRYL